MNTRSTRAPSLEFRDDLHHIRLCLRPHPGRCGAVIWRHNDQSLLGRDVAHPLAFASRVFNELPTIRAVAVKCDHDIARFCRIVRWRKQLNVALLGSIQLRRENNVVQFRGPTVCRQLAGNEYYLCSNVQLEA